MALGAAGRPQWDVAGAAGRRSAMNVDELLTKARDAVHVSRVYGEPFEKNGVTVIPAAKVAGGGGGGTGHDETRGDGEGGGLGMAGRPVGAFVIKGDQVSWRPAVDANRVISTVAFVVVVYLVTWPFRTRARAALRSASTS
jgi:uncharacterized spore protein YtfJ